MITEHPGAPEFFQDSSSTGIDLMQLAVGLSYSRRSNEQHSLGFTPIFAVQGFTAEGLDAFRGGPAFPDRVTNNDRDYTIRHYTVGMSYGFIDTSEISGSFMHAPRQRVGGTNPNTGPPTGFLRLEQNEFELTYTRYLR